MNQDNRSKNRETRILTADRFPIHDSQFMILAETLLRQTRLRFPSLEAEAVDIAPIEKGGSDRRFYRIQFSPGHSIVLIKYHARAGRE